MNNKTEGSTSVNSEERIVLNVGGMKYETYRSTLLSLPTSLLGTMFSLRNSMLLHPTNNNEYFFDRNGRAFHYIIEYYRTGRLRYPPPKYSLVSCEELETELDFFQIPIPQHLVLTPKDSKPKDPAAVTVNSFISMLQAVVREIRANLETKVEVIFPWRDRSKFSVEPDIAAITDLIRPFDVTGYNVLEAFGNQIGKYLKKTVSGLIWILNERDASANYPPRFYLMMSFSVDSFDYRAIAKETVLRELSDSREVYSV
ncbi:1015_t:CDS:2 [Paraglomus brasilianum]|uniref:1015_t:CDS:1 n=1 Tax=Paraglomus brasilianum TaxID=144538 RepID=A0A9N8YW98_9GLOM|nr:1015_t:CDS:2 [Paraglomus brasilianum]